MHGNRMEVNQSQPATPEPQRHQCRCGLRLPLALVLVCAILCGSLIIGRQRNSLTAADIAKNPITVVASEESVWREPWTFRVNSAGAAQLTIGAHPQRTSSFAVSKDQLDQLRKLLIQERFFDLGEEYGESAVDSSIHTLTIKIGNVTKTVRLRFLMNWVNYDKPKLREPARAVRVWMLIRGWFQDSDVTDLHKYDQMVLDAANN